MTSMLIHLLLLPIPRRYVPAAIAAVIAVLPLWPAWAETCDPATNDKLVAEARGTIADITKFEDVIRRAGVPVPPALQQAISGFASSVERGIDVGHAAGQVDAEISRIVNDRLSICRSIDEDERMVCEAKIDRQFQARALAAINWNYTGSILRRLQAKWVNGKCSVEKPKPTKCESLAQQVADIGRTCLASPGSCTNSAPSNQVNSLIGQMRALKCPGL